MLGASYALRMVADSGSGLEWLRWGTPLGWVEQLRPLTAPQPLALVPIVALIAALLFLTLCLAGSRDLGASTLPDRASAQAHTRLLSGPLGLTVRMIRPMALGWGVGIAAYALLLGLIAKSAGTAVSASPTIERALARLGARGANAYLAVAFLVLAVMLALVAVGQISAAGAEETEGRLEHFLVRQVSRRSWFVGRAGLTGALIVVGGLLAGFFAWLGAASQHASVSMSALLGAGLNVVPPTLCLFGIGLVALGFWPRAASGAAYGVLVYAFLVELVGDVVGLNHWVLDTSVFHQIAADPAVPPDWLSGAILVALGVAGAVVGALAFSKRDVEAQ